MKIALDTSLLESENAIRGVGVYTKNIIENVVKYKENGMKIDTVNLNGVDASKYDLVHYLNFHPYFLTLPVRKKTKTVVTIHDLIYLIYPKNYPSGVKGKIKFYIQKYLSQQIDAVITVSETSKKDIVRFLNIKPENIFVTHLSYSPSFKDLSDDKKILNEVARKYNLPAKFVLYVGDVNYNKNLPTLITSCHKLKMPLVVCGKKAASIKNESLNINTIHGPRDYLRFILNRPHPENAHYGMLKSMFSDYNIVLTGYVPDNELAAIYNLATVYVQPSYYEGFGFSVLESMACGTPVVISKTNALMETSGGAALETDPHDPKDMTEKINSVITNSSLRADLIRKGNARIKDFSWKKTALKTIEVYKEVYSKSHKNPHRINSNL